MLVALQSLLKKSRSFGGRDTDKPDPAIKCNQMRVRNAEACVAAQHADDSREELSPDPLTLNGRMNLHASQQSNAFFRRQSDDSDEFVIPLGEQDHVLRLNAAAVVSLGVELPRSWQVVGPRLSDVKGHVRSPLLT